MQDMLLDSMCNQHYTLADIKLQDYSLPTSENYSLLEEKSTTKKNNTLMEQMSSSTAHEVIAKKDQNIEVFINYEQN